MASTHDASEVVLARQPGLQGLFRAIVAITAALVVGMTIGNVIDSGRAGVESFGAQTGRVVETEEGLSPLTIGARHITGNVVDEPRWIGASEELFGSQQAAPLTAAEQAAVDRLNGLVEYFNPAVTSADSLLDYGNLPTAYRDYVATLIARVDANAAATARLSGLAEFHTQPSTFSPELIWAVRKGAGGNAEVWDRGGFPRPYDAPGGEALALQVVEQPAPSGPATDRPFGMQ